MGTNHAFQDVVNSLGNNSQAKGFQFEAVIQWWLKNDEFWSQELDPATVKRWSESEFRTGVDIGIDLTAKDFSGNIWAIQVKNWNQEISLPKSEIDKFLTASNTKIFHKRLLVTTTDGISSNALRAIEEQEKPCVVISLAHLEESQVWSKFKGDLHSTVKKVEKELFEHQKDAVEKVSSEFAHSNRGQLIMACGSGKTITAQRIHESVGGETTLVLLPSLLLVQQTLQSWRAECKTPFLALSVCSDSSVNGDEPLSKVVDLPFPVTTDSNEIGKFLSLPGKKVIFSTYQSSPKIEEALTGTKFQFDLVICDEAHRLAGKVDAAYGTIFREGAIPSSKYLFMTATPKVFSSKLKSQASESDIEVNSMDDPLKFGRVFHTFSFAEAIEKNILTDYRVIVMGVSDANIHDLIGNRDFVQFEDETLDAATLASHFGLAKAMQEHSIKRVISFHSRVERARQFTSTHSKVLAKINLKSPARLFAESISGKDPAFKRRLLLDRLRDLEGFDYGIVGNAKCLTEGVDVPSLDGVAFIDPRGSQVDIIQAVGRAIRRGGPEKKVGYIILPVFFPSKNLDEQVIDESQFKPVWQVLNALKSHDEKLEEEINAIRRGLGAKKQSASFPSKLIFDLPLAFPEGFANKIQTYLLEKTSSIWEEWFARFEIFAGKTGHSRPKRESSDDEERTLASWVSHQRHLFNKGQLPQDRVRKLEGIASWTWDPMDAQWMEYYERLAEYTNQNLTSRVPSTFRDADMRPLGKWVAKLRTKRATLSAEQTHLLESLQDWTWDPFADAWETAFKEIQGFAVAKGNCVFSRKDRFRDGRSVGGWVIKQRREKDLLEERQVKLLETLPGWSWNPFDDIQVTTKKELEQYVLDFGDALVPLKFETASGFSLGAVVSRIRQDARKGKLDPELKSFVESLPGWVWHTKKDKWESQFVLVEEFLACKARYPRKGESYKGISLGNWVTVQRRMLTEGKLSNDRRERLESLPGWSWNTKDQQWESAFKELQEFLRQNNGVKPKDKEKSSSGFGVGSWVYQQRKNWSKLSPEQKAMLSELPIFQQGIAIESNDERWERNFLEAKAFITANGRLPKYRGSEVSSTFEKQLGLWLSRQTASLDTIEAVKRAKLLGLPGFSEPKSSEEVWMQRLSDVVEEMQVTGKIPPLRIQGKEHPNGGWIRRQRKQLENLSTEQRKQLKANPELWKFINS